MQLSPMLYLPLSKPGSNPLFPVQHFPTFRLSDFRTFISILLFLLIVLASCSSTYKGLPSVQGDVACIQQFKPQFTSVLYAAQVDVAGRHLSGLLLMKIMPDSSARVVFTSETGFKFFDFEFSANEQFKVYQVIKQMNKKAVIKTLRKDFELVMLRNTPAAGAYIVKKDELNYYAFPQQKGVNYYVTDSACTRLVRMERASKRKAVVEAIMQQYVNGVPDTIGITHKNFNFTIGLKYLPK
jgi:hypothetical protein